MASKGQRMHLGPDPKRGRKAVDTRGWAWPGVETMMMEYEGFCTGI